MRQRSIEALLAALPRELVADIISYLQDHPGTWQARLASTRSQMDLPVVPLMPPQGLSDDGELFYVRGLSHALNFWLSMPIQAHEMAMILASSLGYPLDSIEQLMREDLPSHLEPVAADWRPQFLAALENFDTAAFEQAVRAAGRYSGYMLESFGRMLADALPFRSIAGSEEGALAEGDVISEILSLISAGAIAERGEEGGLGSALKKAAGKLKKAASSEAGRAVIRTGLTVAGTAAGSYAGNPQMGMMMGKQLGDAVAPPKTLAGQQASAMFDTAAAYAAANPGVMASIAQGQVPGGLLPRNVIYQGDLAKVAPNMPSVASAPAGGKISTSAMASPALLKAVAALPQMSDAVLERGGPSASATGRWVVKQPRPLRLIAV